tara:strand:- start:4624 stop:5241 length:618 start_codon:yes stop_codon:yes gene_type:complete
METLINIYDDELSELILDEEQFTPTTTENFWNLGEVIGGDTETTINSFQNASFVDLHIFDENDNFIITLNSGKPLLQLPSSGKYYFGDYHYHNGTYMVGKKHSVYSHEALTIIKDRQINPYPFNPIEMQANDTKKSKYAIKLSEVFQVLKNIENFNLQVDKKYKIKYAVFGDVLLQLATQIHFAGGQTAEEDIVDSADEGGGGGL